MERHVKLEPIATLTDGVFIAGCCESPKDIPDTVAQAKGAAAEVLSLLARGAALTLDGKERVMLVNRALCKGCGACAVACPSSAISLSHFTPRQILEQVEALTY
jgi:heterodisulfide reductase subunit A